MNKKILVKLPLVWFTILILSWSAVEFWHWVIPDYGEGSTGLFAEIMSGSFIGLNTIVGMFLLTAAIMRKLIPQNDFPIYNIVGWVTSKEW